MTDIEIKLKVLEILTPTCSRLDMTKAQIVEPGGIAEKYLAFVKSDVGIMKASQDNSQRSPAKK